MLKKEEPPYGSNILVRSFIPIKRLFRSILMAF